MPCSHLPWDASNKKFRWKAAWNRHSAQRSKASRLSVGHDSARRAAITRILWSAGCRPWTNLAGSPSELPNHAPLDLAYRQGASGVNKAGDVAKRSVPVSISSEVLIESRPHERPLKCRAMRYAPTPFVTARRLSSRLAAVRRGEVLSGVIGAVSIRVSTVSRPTCGVTGRQFLGAGSSPESCAWGICPFPDVMTSTEA